MKKLKLIFGIVLMTILLATTTLADGLPVSKGSTGDTVKKIQEKLIELGFLADIADGQFGNNTEQAVKAFQEKNTLDITGIVDEQTYTKLMWQKGETATSSSSENTADATTGSSSGKTVKAGAYSYSTNDEKSVRKGATGIYAYKTRGGTYSNYIIVDFTEGCVYVFHEGNGDEDCERVKIDSGDLNTVLMVTYHDGTDTWQEGMHFKYVDNPDHLIHQDYFGFETDFYPTDVEDAMKLKNTKRVVDY